MVLSSNQRMLKIVRGGRRKKEKAQSTSNVVHFSNLCNPKSPLCASLEDVDIDMETQRQEWQESIKKHINNTYVEG